MKKLFRKLIGNQTALPSDDTETGVLGRHFESIRTTALEIHGFKEKVTSPTPTQTVRRPVDIDVAWPSCRDLFIQVFGVLNGIAARFDIEQGSFFRGCGFENAIAAFIETLDRVTLGLADAIGTGTHAPKELEAVAEQIVLVQAGINRLRKYVVENFNYQTAPVRPTVTVASGEAPEKITPLPSNSVISSLF